MAFTTGFTLQAWQQHYQQQPQQVLSTLEVLLASLSIDDNAWLYLATKAQLEPLLVAWQQRFQPRCRCLASPSR